MQRINSHLHMQRTPSYIVNLDPAVANTPYDPNIDIRDTVGAHAYCMLRAGIPSWWLSFKFLQRCISALWIM
jgi:Conserved hypothetical ATP binding protein